MATSRMAARLSAPWLALRDRLLADAGFQRQAMRFAPTRWIARRKARALFDLCAGFVYSQILFACVELDLFAILADGPQDLSALARRMGLDEPAALSLLEGARALRLVEARGPARYGLGELGAALRGNPGVAAMVEHHAMLYADLADPVALLRGEPVSRKLAAYWPYAAGDGSAPLTAASVSSYTRLMSASQAMVATQVLDAYSFARHRCILDVGGGDGTFLSHVAGAAKDLRLVLFDLPPVADRAAARFAEAGLAGRARAVGGDFRSDPLPRGADVATLVRVAHDHDDATVLTILRAIRAALPDDGTLLIAEPLADTRGAAPVGHAYFGFYLLAMGSGRPRSAATLSTLLASAGFARVRTVATRAPMVTSLLVANP